MGYITVLTPTCLTYDTPDVTWEIEHLPIVAATPEKEVTVQFHVKYLLEVSQVSPVSRYRRYCRFCREHQ